MSRLLGHHTLRSASNRLATLLQRAGLGATLCILLASLDEKHPRRFDRRYPTDADRSLMFRPFSRKLTRTVLDAMAAGARSLNKVMTMIFTERMLVPDSYAPVFAETGAFRAVSQAGYWGQAFYVFQCGA